MQDHIYIVFSATPYFIGKAIRKITGETYNHASIALDEDLSRMYGFARRYYRTPLYGGFVRETLSRYHVNGQSTQVQICKLPVTTEQYITVEKRLTRMHEAKDVYIYNHISALGALLRKPIRAMNAYTCVEFCVEILHELGLDLDPKKYYSVGDVEKILRTYEVYTGPMPQCQEFDEAYYAKKPVAHPTLTTVCELLKILPRLGQ